MLIGYPPQQWSVYGSAALQGSWHYYTLIAYAKPRCYCSEISYCLYAKPRCYCSEISYCLYAKPRCYCSEISYCCGIRYEFILEQTTCNFGLTINTTHCKTSVQGTFWHHFDLVLTIGWSLMSASKRLGM